jgi:hypothetical protein
MDNQGKARSFPDPGSVLVDVSELSTEERALILFRHARAAGLEEQAKNLLRVHAAQIIGDPEFTPERIRRFVGEALPPIIQGIRSGNTENSQVKLAVSEALRNPTKQMKLSFRGLPPGYKWFLVALLEVPTSPGSRLEARQLLGNLDELRELYETYCPDDDREPFERVAEHLTEAFVKSRTTLWKRQSIDWIHPSYRDLVIEELIQDAALRTNFLRRASLEGVKLAVSDTGGRFGNRRMPLIRSAESWDTLEQRCLALASNEFERELLEVLANAASQGASTDQAHRWEKLLARTCRTVQEKWDRLRTPVPTPNLGAFIKARSVAKPEPPLPNLEPTWDSLSEHFMASVRTPVMADWRAFDAFGNLTSFARVVQECAPEFLTEKGFPKDYDAEMQAILLQAESEAEDGPETGDPDELRRRAARADGVAASLEQFADLPGSHSARAGNAAEGLRDLSTSLEQAADEAEPPEPDSYEEDSDAKPATAESAVFDLLLLFSEL